MKSKLTLTILFSALLTLPAAAQGRGQGGAGGGARGGDVGAQSGQRGQSPETGQRGGQPDTGQQKSAKEQERERIRATEQQRVHVATCEQSGNRVSAKAREMAEAAKGGGSNNAEFRRLHEQLQQEIRTMQQDRDRFTSSLGDEQRQALQNRIRNLDQASNRLNERIRFLDAEIAKPDQDRKRVRDYAGDVEKATNEYQKRLRETARDMGVEP